MQCVLERLVKLSPYDLWSRGWVELSTAHDVHNNLANFLMSLSNSVKKLAQLVSYIYWIMSRLTIVSRKAKKQQYATNK